MQLESFKLHLLKNIEMDTFGLFSRWIWSWERIPLAWKITVVTMFLYRVTADIFNVSSDENAFSTVPLFLPLMFLIDEKNIWKFEVEKYHGSGWQNSGFKWGDKYYGSAWAMRWRDEQREDASARPPVHPSVRLITSPPPAWTSPLMAV